jgi:hypothetical protein
MDIVNISIKVVEDLKIRDRGKGEVLGKCASCGCDDANYNIIKGLGRCWHCNCKFIITGITADYVVSEDKKEQSLNISDVRSLYGKLVEKYHQNIAIPVMKYLTDRGLSQATIDKFKLGFCPTDFYDEYNDSLAEKAGIITKGYPILTNRVTIPYLFNNEATDIRGRIVNSVFQYKDHTPTYLSLPGGHSMRGSTYLFNHDVLKNSTVIITEGEFKAIVADQYGFPVLSTPGIFGWQKEWAPLFKGKEVILAADVDKTAGCQSPAFLMTKMLVGQIPQLKVALLNWVGTKGKVDIDSLIVGGNVKAFDRSVRGAINARDWLIMEGRKGSGSRS